MQKPLAKPYVFSYTQHAGALVELRGDMFSKIESTPEMIFKGHPQATRTSEEASMCCQIDNTIVGDSVAHAYSCVLWWPHRVLPV